MKMVPLIIVLTFMLVPVNLLYATPSGAGSPTNNSIVQNNQTSSGASDFVTRLYQLCLGHEPDPTGQSFWVDALQTGQSTGADVAYGFVFSDEFQNRAVGDRDFVTILYNALIGRNPDIDGLNNWLSELYNGMSRYAVFAGFANSTEFGNLCQTYAITQGSITLSRPADIYRSTTAFMTRLYRLCLNRVPDPASLSVNNWVNDLQTGKNTVQGVMYGFIFSDEFQNRNLSNADFITIMYRVLLDREPDAGGFADWLNIINSGVSRYQIFQGFVNSDEFHNRWNTFDTNYGYIDIIPVSAINSITGTAKVGVELTAGTLTPANATVSYQWQSSADGITYSAVSGATGSTYTIPLGSVNAFYKVTATGTGNYIGIVTSAATSAVTKADPTVTASPRVSDLTYGQALSNAMLTNASASVAGTFSFNEDNGVLDAGIYSMAWTFNPTDTANYNTTTGNVSVTVNKRDLTVTAAGVNKVYDGSTVAAVTLGSDKVSGDVLTLSYTSASFADKNVSADKAVTAIGISISGTDAENYTVNATASTTADITAKLLSATATGTDKIYDSLLSGSGTIALATVETGDIVTATGTFSFADKIVGTDKPVAVTAISLSGADAGNYTVNATASTTADITAKDLTITAVDNEKYYGDADPSSFTAAYSGFVYGENASNLSGSLSLNRAAGEDAGNYLITANGLTSSNYNIIFQTGNFTINPRPITILSASASKVYDGTTLTIYNSELDTSVPLLSLRLGDDLVTVTTTGYQKNVGFSPNTPSGAIIMRGADTVTGNYAITYATGTLTVTERPITITAKSSTGTYSGTAMNVSGWDLTGGTVPAPQVLTANASAAGTNAGVYITSFSNIRIMAGADEVTSNYAITTIQGTLTINQLPITIIGSNAAQVYDGTILVNHTSTLSAGKPMASGDELVTVTTTGSQKNFGESANTPSGAVIMRGADIVTGNYIISYTPGTLTVTQRPITLTSVTGTKTYDGTTSSAGTPILTSGSLASGQTGSWTQSFASSAVGTSINLIPGWTIMNGAENVTANYNVSTVYVMGTINQRPITLTAVTETKGYDGTTSSAGTPILTSGSLASGQTGSWTQTFASSAVGTNINLIPGWTIMHGAENVTANYNVSTVYAMGTINKGIQTLTLSAAAPSGDAGTTIALSASAPGAGAVTYAVTGGTSIGAAVSGSGEVTLGTAGTVTVTATIAECSHYYSASNSVTVTSNPVVPTITAFTASRAGSFDGNYRDLATFTPTVSNLSGSSYPVSVTYSISKTSSHGSIDYAGGGANTARLAVGTYTITCTATNSIGSDTKTYSLEIPETSTSVGQAEQGLTGHTVQLVYNGTGAIVTHYSFVAITASGHSGNDNWNVIGYTGVNLSGSSSTLASGTANAGVTNSNDVPEASGIRSIVFTYNIDPTHGTTCLSSNVSYSVSSLIPFNDVNLVNAVAPVITTALTNPTTAVGTAVTPLDATATVTDGGTVSYQWYSNPTASTTDGTALVGSTAATYAPAVDVAGTFYYYCVVTNTNNDATGAKTAMATSAVSTVAVGLVNAVAPVITTLTNPTTTVGTAVTLNATATVTDGGTVSYQWYSNPTALTINGTAFVGSTAATYAPAVDVAGTFYYYCVVTNTNNDATGAKTATATSAVSTVQVVVENLATLTAPGAQTLTATVADETAAKAALGGLVPTVAVTTATTASAGTTTLPVVWSFTETFNPASGATNVFTWTATLGYVTNTDTVTVTGTVTVTNHTVLSLTGVAVNVLAEKITGTTIGMQYSLNSTTGSDGTWSDCTASDTTVTFVAGKVYVREKADTANFSLVATIAAAGAPAESITGTFPADATSINLAALANNAAGLEAAVAINGSSYAAYADLTVSGTGTATISPLVDVTTSTKVRIRVKETATTLAGTYKEVTVGAAYVAVTDITGVATTGTVNTALTLAGTVAPTSATNQTIVWTVKSDTATVTGDQLTATATGDVVVTATITNGLTASTPYTHDFTITFSSALSNDATLNTTSTVKGATPIVIGTGSFTVAGATSGTGGSITITAAQAADTTGATPFVTLFDKTNAGAAVKVVKYVRGGGTTGFETDTVFDSTATINDGDFFIVKVVAADTTTVLYYKVVVTVTLSIGDSYAGGKVAYIFVSSDPGYESGEVHGLIAAKADQGSNTIRWATADYLATPVTGTLLTLGSGLENTNRIVVQNGVGSTYAAGLARAYEDGGYTDWYLPSRDELNKLYVNQDVIGGFVSSGNTYYWSSSEFNSDNAWIKDFGSTNESYYDKGGIFHVRAVRTF